MLADEGMSRYGPRDQEQGLCSGNCVGWKLFGGRWDQRGRRCHVRVRIQEEVGPAFPILQSPACIYWLN